MKVYRGYNKEVGPVSYDDWIYVTPDIEQAKWYATKNGDVKDGAIIEYDMYDDLTFLSLHDVNIGMEDYDEAYPYTYTIDDLLWHQEDISEHLYNYGAGIVFEDPVCKGHMIYILFDEKYLKNGRILSKEEFDKIQLNESVNKGVDFTAYHGGVEPDMTPQPNRALYLTDSFELAHKFARREVWNDGLYEGEIPTVFTFKGHFNNPYYMTLDEYNNEGQDSNIDIQKWIEMGVDGIIIPPNEEGSTTYYIVIDLSTIKLIDKKVFYDEAELDDELDEQVTITESEDLTKFNRIAGFYHYDTGKFDLFPRTSEDISVEDDEINDYIHNVVSSDEFTEFNIVRFGIEDIPGEGVVCYMEGDTKPHVEKCYYAIIDKYQEELDIVKYELEYHVGNEAKYIFYDRYGNEIMESVSKLKESSELPKLSKAFWNWFQGSKAVDKNGNPKILWHASSKTFNKFSSKFVFACDNKKDAEYIMDPEAVPNPIIYPVFMKLLNPYVLDLDGQYWNQLKLPNDLKERFKNILSEEDLESGLWSLDEILAVIQKNTDYDGAIICNVAEGDGDIITNDYIAFSPQQVQIITNTDKLFESIIHAKSNGNQLTNVVLKNPTRKELEDNNIERARCMVDGEGNWYFCDLYNNLHFEIENLLRGSTSFPYYDGNDSYGISYYDVEGNEFWYNSNEIMPREKCVAQYYESQYLRKNFPDAYIRDNPYGNNSEDYEEESIELNETARGSESFWKWFRGSKVVDKEGNPLVVYHGTNDDFNEFKQPKENDGIYFTPDKEYAKSEGNNVIEAYLCIKNPRIIKYDSTETIEEMKQNGYDGCYIEDMYYWIAFYPNQIKSVKNGGRWDGSSNNIYESVIKRDDGEIGGYYTQSTKDLLNIINNKYPENDIRVLYDIDRKLYIFADTYTATHFNLILYMVLFTDIYDDVEEIRNSKYADDEVLQDIIKYELYLASFKIFRNYTHDPDEEFIRFLKNIPENETDSYSNGYTCKINNDLWAVCREDEVGEAKQVPLLQNKQWIKL